MAALGENIGLRGKGEKGQRRIDRDRRHSPFPLFSFAPFRPSAGEVALARPVPPCFNRRMDPFLRAAIEEARKGLAAGGIPIGSVLVHDGKIIGRGHNQRVQHGSVIHHAEMNCLENAGRQKASVYARCTLYSTLSPCPMCSGAALLYKIPRIVVGENVTFQGPEEYVRSQGVTVEILNDPTCIQLMRDFIQARPELWNEDIGV